ncbi:hypothetical protein ACFZA2_16525 [Microbacterium sp. NPDC007973]|uniref:hypothetical protein n=1 Tax=Microbacterium sp. NPDC007973 TaxID=3364182 RepID=UPI0036E419FC
MTRTSPEPRHRGRHFALVSTVVIAVLVIAGSLLAAAAFAQGPQVRAVTGDPASAVAQRDVVVSVRTDQPLDPSSTEGIALEPAAPMQVEVVGASLRVRFLKSLEYATAYRLVVPALRGQTTGTLSSTEYSFTTPPLTMTTLERGGAFERAEGDDAVVRHDLSHGSDATILSAPRIQEYAESGGDTVAVAVDRDGATSVQLARGDGSEATLPLPGRGDVRLLRASSDAGRIGYVFTGSSEDGVQQYTGVLFLADLSDPSAPPRTVAGLDGEPVRTEAWQFVPGSAYLVAQTTDRSLLLVDATGAAPPRVLGQLGDLLSFLPGTTSVVLGGADGLSILDLTSGSVTDVDGTRAIDAAPGTGRLMLAPDAIATWTTVEVTRGAPGRPGALVAAAESGSRIVEVCASPSGRHLAIGVVPDAGPMDGYPARADRVGRRTQIVDATNGDVIADVEGTRPGWCG